MRCDACGDEVRPSEATLGTAPDGRDLVVHSNLRTCASWLSATLKDRQKPEPTPPRERRKPQPREKPTRAERLAANANRPRGRVRFDDLYGAGE